MAPVYHRGVTNPRGWTTLDRVATAAGSLELRQRGPAERGDFLITIAGRVLMTSRAARSEQALGRIAAGEVSALPSPRVLVGGLGMGFTLRAALDALPASAHVTVVELEPHVVAWCRGPLAVLTNRAIEDRRVKVQIADAAAAIAQAPRASWDAIVLDLFEGPHEATQAQDDPFYGSPALARARDALAPRGVLAVWSEERDPAFERRLGPAGFSLRRQRVGGGRAHDLYICSKLLNKLP
jgi:spermidine synthase